MNAALIGPFQSPPRYAPFDNPNPQRSLPAPRHRLRLERTRRRISLRVHPVNLHLLEGVLRLAPSASAPCNGILKRMDKIAMLTGMLAEHPTDAFTRYGLAMALAAEGRNDDALREFATTLEHNPDYVPAFQMCAQTLLKLGRSDEARQRLNEGLAAAARTRNSHAASEMQAMLDDLA